MSIYLYGSRRLKEKYLKRLVMEVTTNCVQLMGGYGYCSEFPVERMMRDAKITQIYEGSNQIQRMIIGREVIGRF